MNTTLLLIDIQNDYFENGTNPLAGSLSASENAAKVLKKFRDENLPVIHVQHLATRPEASFFVSGTTGAEIHYNVKPLPHELVIEKHFPNSFRETGLLVHLKSLEINGKEVKADAVHHSFLAAMSYFYAKVMNTKDCLSEVNHL